MSREAELLRIAGARRLSEAERAVLGFIADHLDDVRDLGVRGIAERCFTSTSTVMRLARKLGYDGFVDMCYRLSAELGREDPSFSSAAVEADGPALAWLDGLSLGAVRDAARRMRHSMGFTHVYGCGYSSIMAAYLNKKLLGCGSRTLLSSADDSIAVFENNLDLTDVLIVFSRSGRTGRVLDRVRVAADEGICTVAFTCDRASELAELADFTIGLHDESPADDRNIEFTLYFARCIAAIEYLIGEYRRLAFE